MDSIPEFEDLPLIQPVDNFRDYGTLYLSRAGGDSGIGRGDIHQSEDLILARLLSQDYRIKIFLGSIGTGARLCVKPHLV